MMYQDLTRQIVEFHREVDMNNLGGSELENPQTDFIFVKRKKKRKVLFLF